MYVEEAGIIYHIVMRICGLSEKIMYSNGFIVNPVKKSITGKT